MAAVPGRSAPAPAPGQNLWRIAARTENWFDDADGPSVPTT